MNEADYPPHPDLDQNPDFVDPEPTDPSEAVRAVLLVLRIVFTLIGVGLGAYLALCFRCKCECGIQWLEKNVLWFLPISFGLIPLVSKRLWLGVILMSALFVWVNFVLVDKYFQMIHPAEKR